jgi:hypothetical protein
VAWARSIFEWTCSLFPSTFSPLNGTCLNISLENILLLLKFKGLRIFVLFGCFNFKIGAGSDKGFVAEEDAVENWFIVTRE